MKTNKIACVFLIFFLSCGKNYCSFNDIDYSNLIISTCESGILIKINKDLSIHGPTMVKEINLLGYSCRHFATPDNYNQVKKELEILDKLHQRFNVSDLFNQQNSKNYWLIENNLHSKNNAIDFIQKKIKFCAKSIDFIKKMQEFYRIFNTFKRDQDKQIKIADTVRIFLFIKENSLMQTYKKLVTYNEFLSNILDNPENNFLKQEFLQEFLYESKKIDDHKKKLNNEDKKIDDIEVKYQKKYIQTFLNKLDSFKST